MLEALEALPLDGATVRLSKSASASARMLAFSKLVSQAYGLLAWFENENIKPFLAEWKHLKRWRRMPKRSCGAFSREQLACRPRRWSG